MKLNKTYLINIEKNKLIPIKYDNPFEEEKEFDQTKAYIRKETEKNRFVKNSVNIFTKYFIYTNPSGEEWEEAVIYEEEMQIILMELPYLCKKCKNKIKIKKLLEKI